MLSVLNVLTKQHGDRVFWSPETRSNVVANVVSNRTDFIINVFG